MPVPFYHSVEKTTREALGFNKSPERYLQKEASYEEQLLHEILRGSLGEDSLAQTLPKAVPCHTKSPEEPTSIFFRLVSWKNPPRNISLTPKYQPSVSVQWPIEDTVKEAHFRHVHAKKAAVDAKSLTSSSIPTSKSLPSKLVVPVRPNEFSGGFPNLLLTKRVTQPIAAEDSVRCCPIVSIQDTKGEAKQKKRRRKRNSVKKLRPPAAFFRPLDIWGGKSAGYAMGWRGSWPVRHAGSQKYARDVMRKAVLSTLK